MNGLDKKTLDAHYDAFSRLSRRQFQVAKGLGRNETARRIAKRLRLSPRTVEKHVEQVFRRTGFRSRVDVRAALVALGWVSA